MAKDFGIAKPAGLCVACGGELPPGADVIALAKFGEEGFVREDYHPACWVEPLEQDESHNVNVLGVWRTHIPVKQEKKKLLVDDALLINFFQRLEGQEAEDRVAFRYVLALILMRKKILIYKGSEQRPEGEVWKMAFRKSDDIQEVLDPGLDEDRISEVSMSLSDIMEGDVES